MTTIAAEPVAGHDRREPTRRLGWAPLVVFGAAAAAGVILSVHVARGDGLLGSRWGLLTELAAWALAWLVAAAAALRLPARTAVPLIVVAALALRLGAIAGPPLTSDDLFRYSWDGRVQAAGINPYGYAPTSPQLAPLRESWLWPEEQPCPVPFRPDGCTRINRSEAHTIYPPGAEAWFAGVYKLTGIGARHKPWQVTGLATDLMTVVLLATALRRRGKDPRWVALYALCPAPVLEIVNNGHVDGLAILLMVAALTVASPPAGKGRVAAPQLAFVYRNTAEKERQNEGTGRLSPTGVRLPEYAGKGTPERGRGWRWSTGRRELAAGALVGLAALVKLYPVLLVLVIAAASADRRSRSLLRTGGAALAVCAAGYLPHILAVGNKVLGFLPEYLREEQYNGAGRYLVAAALRIPGDLAGPLSALAVAGASAWVWLRRPPAPVGATVVMGTLLVAASPVQPWYAVALLAFATLAVMPQWTTVVAAGYPYFFAVILLHPHQLGIGQLAYGLAAAMAAVTALIATVRLRGVIPRGRAPARGDASLRC